MIPSAELLQSLRLAAIFLPQLQKRGSHQLTRVVQQLDDWAQHRRDQIGVDQLAHRHQRRAHCVCETRFQMVLGT